MPRGSLCPGINGSQNTHFIKRGDLGRALQRFWTKTFFLAYVGLYWQNNRQTLLTSCLLFYFQSGPNRARNGNHFRPAKMLDQKCTSSKFFYRLLSWFRTQCISNNSTYFPDFTAFYELLCYLVVVVPSSFMINNQRNIFLFAKSLVVQYPFNSGYFFFTFAKFKKNVNFFF